MNTLQVDDRVRLTKDVPELFLHRGAVGIIRSTWFAPSVAYEVEFDRIGTDCQIRALLTPQQIEIPEMIRALTRP